MYLNLLSGGCLVPGSTYQTFSDVLTLTSLGAKGRFSELLLNTVVMCNDIFLGLTFLSAAIIMCIIAIYFTRFCIAK